MEELEIISIREKAITLAALSQNLSLAEPILFFLLNGKFPPAEPAKEEKTQEQENFINKKADQHLKPTTAQGPIAMNELETLVQQKIYESILPSLNKTD